MEDSIEEKKKRSLKYSIIEGSFWSGMFGFGEKYLSAFAVFLQATNTQIGLLTSLPLLFGSVLQYFSTKLIDTFKSRKKFVMTAIFIQAVSWLLILSVFYLGEYKVYFLIFFAIIYWVSGMISGPAWNSWMGDLVDSETRGKYFSKRNRIIGLGVMISTILAGLILDYFKRGVLNPYYGFLIVFLIAFVSRMMSTYFLGKKYEPDMIKLEERDKFSFTEFVKQARFRNYGLFVLFLSLLNFSIYISAPFFAAYMLYDLELSYFSYMILISIAFVSKFIFLPMWGNFSDEYGNKKILTFTGLFITLVPLLWLVSKNFYYLIFVELFSGLVWAGFEISSFNFIFDTTTPQKRPLCVSYYNIINGVFILMGTTLGSLVIKYNWFFWSDYYMAFLVSGIARFLVFVMFVPKLREVRKVTDISYNKIFLKGMEMILTGSFHNFTFLLNYPKKFRIRKD